MSAQQLSDNISPEMKQQMAQTVMNDPAVQEMVRQQAAKAGTDAAEALKDPAVQAKIMETCKEKFPQYAAMGADKMKEFCSDPEVQAKAQHVCGVVGGYIAGAGGTPSPPSNRVLLVCVYSPSSQVACPAPIAS